MRDTGTCTIQHQDRAGNVGVLALVSRAVSPGRYRRRDFEAKSMMRELAMRCGVVLPSDTRAAADGARVGVCVICNRATAGDMATHIEAVLRENGRVRLGFDAAALAGADKVLLLLSRGEPRGQHNPDVHTSGFSRFTVLVSWVQYSSNVGGRTELTSLAMDLVKLPRIRII